MIKKILVVVVGLVLIVALLASIKGMQIGAMIEEGENFKMLPATVTARKTEAEVWENLIHVVGSLEAVQGVDISATLPGKVDKIFFSSGATVNKGDPIIQQDIDAEVADLRSAEASANVLKLNLDRSKSLLKTKALSQASYDSTNAELKSALARVDVTKAAIDKKTVKAPFSGRLGISRINLGQNLQSGESIVTLQSLDPIYVNFSLPQSRLANVSIGLEVRVKVDSVEQDLVGKVTAINPQADASTRNIMIQATVPNPTKTALPGMFAEVSVVEKELSNVVSVPVTAVQYAPYGNSVFIIDERDDSLFLRKQIVRLGVTRGDFVAVSSGLKEGEKVVTIGGFKLNNGQEVIIDNTLSPEFSLEPSPADG